LILKIGNPTASAVGFLRETCCCATLTQTDAENVKPFVDERWFFKIFVKFAVDGKWKSGYDDNIN